MRSIILSIIFLIVLLLLTTNCRKDLNGSFYAEPDTTSHVFSWTIDTLGGYGSIVRDLALIDENDIWAVGKFHFYDSTGIDTATYNAAHWNGEKWDYQFIPSVIYSGDTIYKHIGIHAVFALGKNNLWFASSSGGYMNLYNSEIEMDYLKERYGQILRIWGTGPDNLYFIGSYGNITHYDGSSFNRLYGRPDMEFWDIDGDEERVFVLGRELTGSNSMLLEIRNGKVTEFYYSDKLSVDIKQENYGLVESLDLFDDKLYVMSYAGLLVYNSKLKLDKIIKNFEIDGPNSAFISSNFLAKNDALFQDSGGTLVHYNGNTWFSDPSLELFFSSSYYQLYKGVYKDQIFISGGHGTNAHQGIVVRGKHH